MGGDAWNNFTRKVGDALNSFVKWSSGGKAEIVVGKSSTPTSVKNAVDLDGALARIAHENLHRKASNTNLSNSIDLDGALALKAHETLEKELSPQAKALASGWTGNEIKITHKLDPIETLIAERSLR